MEEIFAISSFYKLYEGHELLVLLCIMGLSVYPILFISRVVILPGMRKVVGYNSKSYLKIVEKHQLSRRIVRLFLAFYILFCNELLNQTVLMSPSFMRAKNVIITLYVIYHVTIVLHALINVGVEIYETRSAAKRMPISLHAQILELFVTICAVMAAISLILGLSISSLFTSLGAAAALLTFVFKDIVLGLVASLQLTFQDIIRIGDWISLPNYNADGDVEKITITVVKIRNFDNTFTTVPTSALLTTGVKNWRSVFEGGGRRIMRSISINMDTVKVCTQQELDEIAQLPCLKSLAQERVMLFNSSSQTTNLTLFRHYVDCYLRTHQGIHKDGFTFLVRQLAPSETGVPIEVYVFTRDTSWVNYENIQGEIFDHLIGILPKFNLRAFQTVVKSLN